MCECNCTDGQNIPVQDKLTDAICKFSGCELFEKSKIDLCELAATFNASKLVLESILPSPPTTEQVLMLATAAAINDLKNALSSKPR